MNAARGLLFDVQGHAVHDGPGCRTLVFLAGCPLRCSWCANPEGQLLALRLMYRPGRCPPGCARCVAACPRGALSARLGAGVAIDRRRCDGCDDLSCTAACYHQALQRCGGWWTLDELLALLERDRAFWGPRGGVTFTGGEPLVQRDFLHQALRACRQRWIHTAVETSACAPGDELLQLAQATDLLLVDLKHADPERHRAATGRDNRQIVANIRQLASLTTTGASATTAGASGSGDVRGHAALIVRIPLLPGFNDQRADLEAMARLLADGCGVHEIELLAFHRLGASKYEQLGLRYAWAARPSLAPEALRSARQTLERCGLRCRLDPGP